MKLLPLLSLTACCLQTASAASNFYFSVQNGNGQVLTRTTVSTTAPAGSIEFDNYTWGATNSATVTQNGVQGNTPQISSLTLERTRGDINSPLIFGAVARNTKYSTMLLTVGASSSNSNPEYVLETYKLSNAIFSSIQRDVNQSDLKETIIVTFAALGWSYTARDNSGAAGQTAKQGFNFASSTDCSGTCL